MRKLSLFCLAAVLELTTTVWADTLVLRNGTRYNGTFLDGTTREISFQDDSGVRRRFNTSEVQSVEFQPASLSETGTVYSRGRRSAIAGAARTLPTGTELAVRTNEEINSTASSEGRTYSAVIERDVMDDTGAVAIPRGSDAQLVVRSVSSGGVTGSPELALDLQSVAVSGQRYLVSTTDIQQRGTGGLGKNRRTAEMVGGGAVLGTVIGAIAGGGKGAAIGAIAGAGAGAAGQVLTRGKQVKVPAESVLTFKLDQPLRLEPLRR